MEHRGAGPRRSSRIGGCQVKNGGTNYIEEAVVVDGVQAIRRRKSRPPSKSPEPICMCLWRALQPWGRREFLLARGRWPSGCCGTIWSQGVRQASARNLVREQAWPEDLLADTQWMR